MVDEVAVNFDSAKYIAMGDELDKLREEHAARLQRIRELRKARNLMMASYKEWKATQRYNRMMEKAAKLKPKVEGVPSEDVGANL